MFQSRLRTGLEQAYTQPMQRSTALATVLSVAVLIQTGWADPTPAPPQPPPWTPPKSSAPGNGAAEGMPPLPFPSVPSKRQEKKQPSDAVTLVTRIKSADPEDWARTPNDVPALLELLRKETGVPFASDAKSIDEIAPDAAARPLLYRSGFKSFKLTESEVAKLRDYCTRGGTIVFNSLSGSPAAYDAARQAAAQIFPGKTAQRLPSGHAIFRSYYPIEKVRFRDRVMKDNVAPDGLPYFDGVDLGDRTAIIISRWDLSLGWEGNQNDSWGYADEDSCKLGINILAYVMGSRTPGK
jgi:hypothetical protein